MDVPLGPPIEGIGQPGASEVRSAGWIKTKPASNRQLVQALRQDLDAGEAEAIALALETQADLLLMDERIGRESARYFGLHFTGLIGILIEAKSQGLIDSVKVHLDELRNRAGFRVRNELYLRVLADQGEV